MAEYDILKKSPLFNGLDDFSMRRALELYSAYEDDYPRGTAVANAGTPLNRFGLVISGRIQVNSDDIDGNRVIMAAVGPGGTFGESLCWLAEPEIPVSIVALADSRVMWLCPDFIRNAPADAFAFSLAQRFISMLAARTLAMNDRIQVLSRITLREKLTVFFSLCSGGGTKRNFDIPFDRESLAVYLGANRSSLSRELSAMKRDGIIDYYKNSFRLL